MVSSVPNDYKRIALTFDDGPSENTFLILNKLDELGIQATFFLIGSEINERMVDTIAIVEAGHAVGNHSYSHRRMMLVSYNFVREEIERTNDLIRESGFEDTIFFRPPFGRRIFILPLYLHNAGISTVMWDIEPETVLGFGAAADEIAEYVIENVQSGSIILLHPMYNPENVLSALDIIVPELINKGYSFHTITDLLK